MIFQYEPELDAFLEFLIWRFSIWVDKPTPGNALMNLRYRDERAFESRSKGQWFLPLLGEIKLLNYILSLIIVVSFAQIRTVLSFLVVCDQMV